MSSGPSGFDPSAFPKVDQRLYLPQEWTTDKKRCCKAGVPKLRQRHCTRHALCLEMLRQHGPQLEIVKRRVVARTFKRQAGHDEVLIVIRYKDRDDQQVVKTDYYLSNAAPETSLVEFARVAQTEHRIEECLQRAKSEAGLARTTRFATGSVGNIIKRSR
jgi:hypothetical protein